MITEVDIDCCGWEAATDPTGGVRESVTHELLEEAGIWTEP